MASKATVMAASMAKYEKAMEWVKAHPAATYSAAFKEAGIGSYHFYRVKRVLRASALAPASARKVVRPRASARTVKAPKVNGALTSLVHRLEAMGVKELHYQNGKLRVGVMTWEEVQV